MIIRGVGVGGEVAFPVFGDPWKQFNTCSHASGCCTLFYARACSNLEPCGVAHEIE